MAEKKKASLGGKLSSALVYKVINSNYAKKRGGIFSVEFMNLENTFKAPKGYDYKCYKVGDLPVEKLSKIEGGKPDKVVLELHGGGYILPMAGMYRTKGAMNFCKLSGGATVYNIDYRVAPQHVFPAALEDALQMWDYLLEQGHKPKDIIVTGDSAGGNLTLALTLKLRELGRELPCALICMSPWADLAGQGPSYRERVTIDPMFGQKVIKDYDAMEKQLKANICKPYAGDTPFDDPMLSPVYNTYENFPPMLIQVGEREILNSDSRTIYEKAKAEGVDVTLTEYPGVFHVFQFLAVGRETREAWAEVGEFLRRFF